MLLFGGSGQVDPGCFNAFVSHKVCKQRNIIKLCQKILGKPMPERVRINLFRGDLISFCQYFQLEMYTSGSDNMSVSVKIQPEVISRFFSQSWASSQRAVGK